MAQENREDLMLTLGKSFQLYNRVDSLEKINAKIEKVTASELMEIANEVLDREKLSTLIFK
jgi:predicted Zn-dependent peptidase